VPLTNACIWNSIHKQLICAVTCKTTYNKLTLFVQATQDLNLIFGCSLFLAPATAQNLEAHLKMHSINWRHLLAWRNPVQGRRFFETRTQLVFLFTALWADGFDCDSCGKLSLVCGFKEAIIKCT